MDATLTPPMCSPTKTPIHSGRERRHSPLGVSRRTALKKLSAADFDKSTLSAEEIAADVAEATGETWNGLCDMGVQYQEILRYSLRFRNDKLEKAYACYFTNVRGVSLRLVVLGLLFLDMMFWLAYGLHTSEELHMKNSSPYQTPLAVRLTYFAVLLGLFFLSFGSCFEKYTHIYVMTLAILTGAELVLEAYFLDAKLSPFIMLAMMLDMISWSILVRLRFVCAFFVTFVQLILWNACMFFFSRKFRT